MVRVILDCGFPLAAVVGPHAAGSPFREGEIVTALVRAEAVRLLPAE
jgi:hypothetical protein